MKKINLKIVAFISVLSFTGTAFAAMQSITGAVTFGGGTFSPSAKVTIKADSDGQKYAAASQHINGKKQFGTNNTDPKIYFKEAESSGPGTITSADTFSGWSTY